MARELMRSRRPAWPCSASCMPLLSSTPDGRTLVAELVFQAWCGVSSSCRGVFLMCARARSDDGGASGMREGLLLYAPVLPPLE